MVDVLLVGKGGHKETIHFAASQFEKHPYLNRNYKLHSWQPVSLSASHSVDALCNQRARVSSLLA